LERKRCCCEEDAQNFFVLIKKQKGQRAKETKQKNTILFLLPVFYSAAWQTAVGAKSRRQG
jgi:hypothetical protein